MTFVSCDSPSWHSRKTENIADHRMAVHNQFSHCTKNYKAQQ